jgi:hypothetical protein
VHRVGQFVSHVRARVSPEEEALARRVLPGRAWDLFAGMPVADRRHALDVVAMLQAGGLEDSDVLAAALLHDAAKGHRMRLWHRVAGVLLEAFAPALLRRLATPDPRSWRHPFHLYLQHDALSADLAEAAGCGARAAGFIRGRVGTEDLPALRALRAADDAS